MSILRILSPFDLISHFIINLSSHNTTLVRFYDNITLYYKALYKKGVYFMKILNYLWEYLSLIFGTLIVSFVFWFFKPESEIKACWFLPIIVILAISLITVTKIAINYYYKEKQIKYILPKLIEIRSDNAYLFEECSFFTTDSIVAIYCKDQFEDFVACGHLYRRQSDTNYLQVRLLNEDEAIKQFIVSRQKQIYLVPTVPKECIEKIIEDRIEGITIERGAENG